MIIDKFKIDEKRQMQHERLQYPAALGTLSR
jgi:hypothetical protein